MQSESAGVSHELLAAYVDEQLEGLDGAERNRKLSVIRLDLARDIDAGDWTESEASAARAFLADFDRNYPAEPETPLQSRPVNHARAVRRGILAIMPRLMMIMIALMGAARTGGARHAVVAGMAIVFILIGRAAYMSIRAGQA
jgi:hypothetical protein